MTDFCFKAHLIFVAILYVVMSAHHDGVRCFALLSFAMLFAAALTHKLFHKDITTAVWMKGLYVDNPMAFLQFKTLMASIPNACWLLSMPVGPPPPPTLQPQYMGCFKDPCSIQQYCGAGITAAPYRVYPLCWPMCLALTTATTLQAWTRSWPTLCLWKCAWIWQFRKDCRTLVWRAPTATEGKRCLLLKAQPTAMDHVKAMPHRPVEGFGPWACGEWIQPHPHHQVGLCNVSLVCVGVCYLWVLSLSPVRDWYQGDLCSMDQLLPRGLCIWASKPTHNPVDK